MLRCKGVALDHIKAFYTRTLSKNVTSTKLHTCTCTFELSNLIEGAMARWGVVCTHVCSIHCTCTCIAYLLVAMVMMTGVVLMTSPVSSPIESSISTSCVRVKH